jgi:integrase/transcription elongation factor Elf1
VKVYYKHALGDDETYPRQVSWLKTGMKISKKLLPENILDEDEIIKLLDAVNDARDKALIAVLFDTGMRVGELLNMKFGDVDQASHHIVIKGKTGMRRLMLFFSIPYINNYLVSTKKRNPNEYLWLGRGKWTARNRPIDRAAVAKLLRVAARKAGIQKRIYPHLFRHSRATYYASRMKEQTLKSYFGWTSGSAMAATYVHLSGRDMDAAVLEANGEKMPEKADKARLKAPVCHVCKKENIVGSVHCSQCGSALDVETALVAERLQAYGMVHGTSEELFKKYFDDYMKRYMEEKERAGK